MQRLILFDIDNTSPDMAGFKSAYFQLLARNLESCTDGTIRAGGAETPGRFGIYPGCPTGPGDRNFKKTDFIRLRRYGLSRYFEAGGFGGDHTERSQVVMSVVASSQRRSGRTYRPENAWVIGDFPADV